jgi:hypothetical protein
MPVPISVHSTGTRVFSRIMIPFALGSLGALVLPSLIGGVPFASLHPRLPEEWQGYMIHSWEYEAHAAFQASFSVRPFRTGGDEVDAGEYLRYHRDGDGLIGDYSVFEDDLVREIPPFPLEDLMNFLNRRGYGPSPGDLIAVLMVLFFCIPFFLPIRQRYSRKKSLLVYNDKRIAA